MSARLVHTHSTSAWMHLVLACLFCDDTDDENETWFEPSLTPFWRLRIRHSPNTIDYTEAFV